MSDPTTHVLESSERTISPGTIDPTRPAALTIESGDIVSCPNTWTQWGNQARFGMSFADREPLRKQFPNGPYSNLGPVVINGAEPGDAVECRMLRIIPIDWGWNSFPLGVGALPSDFEQPYVHYFRFSEDRTSAEFVDGVRIPLRPSMGVYAVEPEGEEPVSAILAGPYGGNLDLWELTEGTSLFLPVFKPGARIWTGDANATQSDGVVDQTGIESAMEELRVRYIVHKGVTLAGPTIETPENWIVMAFADSLDAALPNCARTAIGFLADHGGIDRRDAYALCSMAISFRITQWADQTRSVYTSTPPRTIHAVIPKSVLGEKVAARIAASLRPAP
ncbi:MAG TPA: acetamidase/formamidase family protein [Solirubrobacteraceae bacterium]|nr:acetamidase/formamidase family protein [Solirubrobacteraceae bacterium]